MKGPRDILVFDALRTPRGKGSPNGSLAATPPYELVSQLVEALRARNGDGLDQAESLLLSCVGQVGVQGGHIALVSRLHSSLPDSVTVTSLNNYCAGGLTAIGLAGAAIRAGDVDLALAGGVESMSQVPFLADRAAYYEDEALARRLNFAPVGLAADYLAFLRGVSRSALDEASYESHQRAARAWRDGWYKGSVIPIRGADSAVILEADETIRPDMTLEEMADMPPVFEEQGRLRYDAVFQRARPDLGEIEHRHSIANCPPTADGAALLLLGAREAGERAGLRPIARLAAFAEASGDPIDQLTAGFKAMEKLLARTGHRLQDFDVIEFMEAFAVTAVLFCRDYEPDRARVNIYGGHLAMGHPMGATGAVLSTTLIHALRARGGGLGLVVATGGSGVGAAAIYDCS